MVRSVIHRADYRRILFEEARKLGATVEFGSQAVGIDCSCGYVHLDDGRVVAGDVVVGADGQSNPRLFVVRADIP